MATQPEIAVGPQFEAEELENSFPLDVGRRFRGDIGVPLIDKVLEGMRSGEVRLRRRRAAAEARERATVEALLANLAAGSLNIVDDERFVAVSFNRNDYVGGDLSLEAMQQCRDFLVGQELIDCQAGFRRLDFVGDTHFGRRSRLRATARLCRMFDDQGIVRKSFAIPPAQLIRIKAKRPGVSVAPPDDVENSRDLIDRINRRLATSQLDLGEEVRIALASSWVDDEGEDTDARDIKRRYAGDLTAFSLYRAFKGDWSSGGRIYGGWWMSLPKAFRPYITIDGDPVVELDYRTLHPRLLFHRAGLELDFDPYVISGFASGTMRNLGKRTFNRLLNRHEPRASHRLKIRAARGDVEILPKRMTFASYRETLCRELQPIQHWFGTGEGVRLQKVDSDLAIAVMREMEAAGVTVLPVHDSFLVGSQHEPILRTAMEEAFFNQQGYMPEIETKRHPGAQVGHVSTGPSHP